MGQVDESESLCGSKKIKIVIHTQTWFTFGIVNYKLSGDKVGVRPNPKSYLNFSLKIHLS